MLYKQLKYGKTHAFAEEVSTEKKKKKNTIELKMPLQVQGQ